LIPTWAASTEAMRNKSYYYSINIYIYNYNIIIINIVIEQKFKYLG